MVWFWTTKEFNELMRGSYETHFPSEPVFQEEMLKSWGAGEGDLAASIIINFAFVNK